MQDGNIWVFIIFKVNDISSDIEKMMTNKVHLRGTQPHKPIPYEPIYFQGIGLQSGCTTQQKLPHKKTSSQITRARQKENYLLKKPIQHNFRDANHHAHGQLHDNPFNFTKKKLITPFKGPKSSSDTPGLTPVKSMPKVDKQLEPEQRKTLEVKSPLTRNNYNVSTSLIQVEPASEKGRIHTTITDQVSTTISSFKPQRKTLPNSTAPAFLRKGSAKKTLKKNIKITDFVFIKQLGMGKYGRVGLMIHKETGFICAVKTLNKKLIIEEEISDTILQQIKIQCFLNHPNIVKAYGCFCDSQNVYLLLEYCVDGNLQRRIRNVESFEEEDLLDVMVNIFQAVFELHCEGILHRDLKPQNIVISHNVYKLCDFGWAVYTEGKNRLTFCGTPLYVSPEVLSGKGYNQKADIWGLGILCYELVYGHVPFKMSTPSDMMKIMQENIQYDTPTHKISQQILSTIKKMLNRDIDERLSINELLNTPFISSYIQEQKKQF